MYDYNGCECAVCHQAFGPGDDIVVCPDCGAPYHRACYAKNGSCVFAAKHGENFEWTPPHRPEQAPAQVRCAQCGAQNPAENTYCRNCGVPLPTHSQQPEGGARSAGAAGTAGQGGPARPEGGGAFDYAGLYADPYGAAYREYSQALDPNEKLAGIPIAEWSSYIGPASRTYLNVFRHMEVLGRHIAPCFSAMFFGPFYFFYRKAWQPAFVFSAIELVLNIPSLLYLMQLSGRALPLAGSTLTTLSTIASVLSFVVMAVRGSLGFYLYQKCAAKRIRAIQSRCPDPNKRRFVLIAQGGTSWAAVFVALFALMLLASLFSLLLGPDIEAVMNILYN